MYTPPVPVGEEQAAGERAPLLSTQGEQPGTRSGHSQQHQARVAAVPLLVRSEPGPEDIQDVQTFWNANRNRWLLNGLFISSVITVVVTFGSSYLALAMLSGFVGIPAVVIHTVKGFEAKLDAAERTRVTSVIAMGGLVLSLVALLQLSWLMFLTNFECRTDPADAPEATCYTDYVWEGLSMFTVLVQAILFKKLLERASLANRLLNPVSSGLVSV